MSNLWRYPDRRLWSDPVMPFEVGEQVGIEFVPGSEPIVAYCVGYVNGNIAVIIGDTQYVLRPGNYYRLYRVKHVVEYILEEEGTHETINCGG